MNRPTLSVLHIDDDPDMRFLAQELLSEAEPGPGGEMEIRWLEAPGVEEAIARHGAARPDLILLDQRLGGGQGVEWLPRIQSAWDCPVWILTGVPEERLLDLAVSQGASGVLSKDELLHDGIRLRSFVLREARSAPLQAPGEAADDTSIGPPP